MTFEFNLNLYNKKNDNDRVNFILSYIHVNYHINKKNNDYEYVPVNQILLKKICGNKGLDILKNLVKNNYLYKDDIYIVNKKSIGYKINYNIVPKSGIFSYKNKYYNKFIKLLNENYINSVDYKRMYIAKKINDFFIKNKITIDKNIAINILKKYKNENYDKYISQYILFKKLQNKDLTIVSDKFNSRIYSTYHNLSKELRKCLYINNENKYIIDIKNSQLQILSLILKNIYNIYDERFDNLVYNGIIYDYIAKKSGKTRDRVKKDILIWLFSDINMQNKIKYIDDIMKNEFNIIYNKLYDIKNRKAGGMYIAGLLQKYESEIVLSIQYKLLKNNIICLTIHDSFLISKKDKYLINYIIHELNNYGIKKVEIEEEKDINKINKNINSKNKMIYNISYVSLIYDDIIKNIINDNINNKYNVYNVFFYNKSPG